MLLQQTKKGDNTEIAYTELIREIGDGNVEKVENDYR